MTRRRDNLFEPTDERFKPRERDRFGDNESAPSRAVRSSGASADDDVDVRLVFISNSKSGLAMGCCRTEAQAGPVIYLPKSQISKCDPPNPQNGETVDLTIPEWLAKEKGLA